MYRFKLPQNLYLAYKMLTQTALVKNKNYTEAELNKFEVILNTSLPLDENRTEYNLIKFLHHTNEFGFGKLVEGNVAEATVLWTDARTIVRWFDLSGILYLSYDRQSGQYRAKPHKKLVDDDGKLLYPFVLGKKLPHLEYNDKRPYGYKRDHRPFKKRAPVPTNNAETFPSLDSKPSSSEFRDKLKEHLLHTETPAPHPTPVQTPEVEEKKPVRVGDAWDDDDPALQILDQSI